MLFSRLLTGLVVFAAHALADEIRLDFLRNVDIYAWPLGASKPLPLATLSYNYQNASIATYTPPTIATDDEIVRVGFFRGSGGPWSGVATAGENFRSNKALHLQLHVDSKAEIYHVGLHATASGGVSQGSPESSKNGLSVEVVEIRTGLPPLLNKPVVVTEGGQVEGKEPEKTFLQKYWWAIGLFLILQVVMSGGKDEEAPKK